MSARKLWNFHSIPEELRSIPQWINWKYAKRNGKTTKPPCTPAGGNMDAQASKNWKTFEQAAQAYEQNPKLAGVGLVLTADLGLVGWDIDDCIGDQGSLDPDAEADAKSLASYCEISPSGAGLRGFAWGTIPVDGRKGGRWEIYKAGRYLTVTGSKLPASPGTVNHNQPGIDAFFEKHFAVPNEAKTEAAEPVSETPELSDERLLELARAAANGDKFSRLWTGDTSQYKSQSEADLALCLILAFWTRKNPAAIDRLFRQSGLYRPKWNQKRGSGTYGSLTIQKAIGRTVETFKSQENQSVGPEDENTPSYFSTRAGLFWNKSTKDGVIPVPLANFEVKITQEIIHFDGAERRIIFDMKAHLRGRRLEFQLPASEFATMNWPPETLGAGAIIEPGQAMKDRLRVAIQTVSGIVTREERFVFTGWHKLRTGWAYLHAGGAIGADGPFEGVQTDLGPLDRYCLPVPPTDDELIKALSATLEFFAMLLCGLGTWLLLIAFRAILSEADAPDSSGWLSGSTGVYKSVLAALVQSFFGKEMADPRNLPANWASTGNSLERLAFLAKDALLVVDDFAPNGTTNDISRMHRDAERVLRAAGNRAGRGRMNSDGSLRIVNFPRGVVLGTGEDVPRGHSLRARLQVREVKPGEIDPKVLSQGQALAAEGIFNSVAAAFISWTASRLDELKTTFPKRKHEIRTGLTVAGHARCATAVADMLACAEVFVRFATDAGAMSESQANSWLESAKMDLLRMAGEQGDYLASEDPVKRFFMLLESLFTLRRAHLEDQNTGGFPCNAELYGWVAVGVQKEEPDVEFYPKGERIGWVSSNGDIYLDSESTFAAIQKLGREQGVSIPVTQTQLWKMMKNSGLLVSTEHKRNTQKVPICGTRRNVLHLHSDQIYEHHVPGSEPSIISFGAKQDFTISGGDDSGEQEWVSIN
ncbi:MAG: DUF927 domain-containing protein [Desulfovibrionales bacterium]|nr:MAG: DUF927 domain-containing protein [Desulfovibrionales bacterium]